MIIPKSLKIGDTIGVIAPSSPIVGDNIEELDQVRLTHVDMLFQGVCNDCKNMKEDKEDV